MECNGCSTLSKPFSNNLPYCKNCLFLYFCHQMLRLCVQNGREFSIKKGNQNNLFCLNTKKICVWPSCAIYLYVTQHQNVYLFSDTQSHRVPRGLRGTVRFCLRLQGSMCDKKATQIYVHDHIIYVTAQIYLYGL